MRLLSAVTKTMAKNMFKDDDNNLQSINYIQCLLLSLGIWTIQSNSPTKTKTYSIILHRLIICVLHLWVIISITIRMCDNNNSLDEKVLLFAPISFTSSSLLKYFGLVYHQNDIHKNLELIKTEWKITDCKKFRQIMIDNMKIEKTIVFRFSGLMFTVAIFYNFFMPFAVTKIKNNRYNTSERIEMYPGYDTFDNAKKTPYYEILYILTVIALYCCFTIHICSSSLGVIFVDFIYSETEIIIWQLNNIFKKPLQKSEIIKMTISGIIMRHSYTINFAKRMGISLKEICFVETVAVTLIVCTSEHCCLKMWERREIVNLMTYSITIIGLSLNFLIFCWISEIIEKQFFIVGTSSYQTDWYKLSAKDRNFLILMIAMAERSRKLTAGGIIDLSFITFINFLKTTFVYLKLLRS